MAKAMATEEVSWPANSKLRIRSRICSVERFECFNAQPSRSSSWNSPPSASILNFRSSIFRSMNFKIVDRDWKIETLCSNSSKNRCAIAKLVFPITLRARLYGVPGRFSGGEITPFMKVTYSFFNISVSNFHGSKLMICFAIKLKVNYKNKSNLQFHHRSNKNGNHILKKRTNEQTESKSVIRTFLASSCAKNVEESFQERRTRSVWFSTSFNRLFLSLL